MNRNHLRTIILASAAVAVSSNAYAAGLSLGGLSFKAPNYQSRALRGALPPQQADYPVAGFQPKVMLSLTDRQETDDFVWTTSPDSPLNGNSIVHASNSSITFATLDTGAQSHVLSGDLYTFDVLSAANRDGAYTTPISGAGGASVDADISDPLGVYISPLSQFNGGVVNPTAWKGHYNAAVLTTPPGTGLPNIVGNPMFAQHQIEILNSQTARRSLGAQTFRAPTINLNPLNSTIDTVKYPIRSVLELADPFNSATSAPAFFPDFGTLDFLDNPTTPTFWTFPFVTTAVTDSLGTINNQQFLFDTGAQVSLLSSQLAADIGFDPTTSVPDFEIQVSGIGGIVTVPGFILDQLRVSSIGGTLSFNNVPVVVLDVTDPRDGIGFVPGILGMNVFNDRDMVINQSPSNPIVRFSQTFALQWNVNAGGDFSTDGNWMGGVPDGEDVPANFLGAITAPKTINVDDNFTVGKMKFDNANSYTLAGSGRITLSTIYGPSQVSVLSGSHTISAPMTFGPTTFIDVAAGAQLTLSGDTETPTADLKLLGPGTTQLKHARVKSLDVAGGVARVLSGGGNGSTSRVESLSISGGTLDLADSKFIVDYTGASPLSTVRGYIVSGQLTSNNLTANRGIGYAEASDIFTTPSDWFGQTIDSTSLLSRLTLLGDADLSGTVDIGDFSRLAAAFNTAGGWSKGDFDFSGTIDIGDFSQLAANFNQSLPTDLPRGSVPEPSAVTVLLTAGALIRRRR
jgi:hypothetical protein